MTKLMYEKDNLIIDFFKFIDWSYRLSTLFSPTPKQPKEVHHYV